VRIGAAACRLRLTGTEEAAVGRRFRAEILAGIDVASTARIGNRGRRGRCNAKAARTEPFALLHCRWAAGPTGHAGRAKAGARRTDLRPLRAGQARGIARQAHGSRASRARTRPEAGAGGAAVAVHAEAVGPCRRPKIGRSPVGRGSNSRVLTSSKLRGTTVIHARSRPPPAAELAARHRAAIVAGADIAALITAVIATAAFTSRPTVATSPAAVIAAAGITTKIAATAAFTSRPTVAAGRAGVLAAAGITTEIAAATSF